MECEDVNIYCKCALLILVERKLLCVDHNDTHIYFRYTKVPFPVCGLTYLCKV